MKLFDRVTAKRYGMPLVQAVAALFRRCVGRTAVGLVGEIRSAKLDGTAC
jgi:hypothetical protein